MELQVNHPETRSYTVADVKVNGYKSRDQDYAHLTILIKPRNGSDNISLSFSKEDWIEFVAETSRILVEIEK